MIHRKQKLIIDRKNAVERKVFKKRPKNKYLIITGSPSQADKKKALQMGKHLWNEKRIPILSVKNMSKFRSIILNSSDNINYSVLVWKINLAESRRIISCLQTVTSNIFMTVWFDNNIDLAGHFPYRKYNKQVFVDNSNVHYTSQLVAKNIHDNYTMTYYQSFPHL